MTFKAFRVLQVWTAAIVLCALAYGGVSAAEKKKEAAPKTAACRTIMTEADCTPRADCTWREAAKNAKTGKETRRASCAAKPKPKPAPKTKA